MLRFKMAMKFGAFGTGSLSLGYYTTMQNNFYKKTQSDMQQVEEEYQKSKKWDKEQIFLVLVGPSQYGKSTFAKTITGQRIGIGSGLALGETDEVNLYETRSDQMIPYKEKLIDPIIVDVPGWNDPQKRMTNSEIMEDIQDVLYLHESQWNLTDSLKKPKVNFLIFDSLDESTFQLKESQQQIENIFGCRQQTANKASLVMFTKLDKENASHQNHFLTEIKAKLASVFDPNSGEHSRKKELKLEDRKFICRASNTNQMVWQNNYQDTKGNLKHLSDIELLKQKQQMIGSVYDSDGIDLSGLNLFEERENKMAEQLKAKHIPKKIKKEVRRTKTEYKEEPVFNSEPCGLLWLSTCTSVGGYRKIPVEVPYTETQWEFSPKPSDDYFKQEARRIIRKDVESKKDKRMHGRQLQKPKEI